MSQGRRRRYERKARRLVQAALFAAVRGAAYAFGGAAAAWFLYWIAQGAVAAAVQNLAER